METGHLMITEADLKKYEADAAHVIANPTGMLFQDFTPL